MDFMVRSLGNGSCTSSIHCAVVVCGRQLSTQLTMVKTAAVAINSAVSSSAASAMPARSAPIRCGPEQRQAELRTGNRVGRNTRGVIISRKWQCLDRAHHMQDQAISRRGNGARDPFQVDHVPTPPPPHVQHDDTCAKPAGDRINRLRRDDLEINGEKTRARGRGGGHEVEWSVDHDQRATVYSSQPTPERAPQYAQQAALASYPAQRYTRPARAVLTALRHCLRDSRVTP
jgi:hypothetical protein